MPLTDRDVIELIREPRGSALLFGYRNSAPCDTEALAGIIQRISALVSALPEIAEMDLNPVIVSPAGAVAVDVKVRLEPYTRDPITEARHLRRPSATPGSPPTGAPRGGTLPARSAGHRRGWVLRPRSVRTSGPGPIAPQPGESAAR